MHQVQDAFFGLRFHPPSQDPNPNSVPVDTLFQTLKGLQRAVHLVAMLEQGRDIQTRVRVGREIEERYRLHWAPPDKGCVYQPVFLGKQGRNNPGRYEPHRVFRAITRIMAAIKAGDEGGFEQCAPNPAYWPHIFESFENMFGGEAKKYALSIEDKVGEVLADHDSTLKGVERLKLVLPRLAERSGFTIPAVTGTISKVDFQKSEVSLLVPGLRRPLSCEYPREFEKFILDGARDLIQVEGVIEADENEVPQRITEISRIHALNTDDIEVSDVLPENLEVADIGNPRFRVS